MNSSKHEIRDGKIVSKASGNAIPDDEPVFVLRARDVHAVETLIAYRGMLGGGAMFSGVDEVVRAFDAFRKTHAFEMKTPD